MIVLHRFLFLVIIFTSSNVVIASNSYLSQITDTAIAQKLYDNPAWLSLLHYRPQMWGANYKSEADDPYFFFSQDGKTNPRAELIATLEAIFSTEIQGDKHPQCRFPARFHWLNEQLHFDQRLAVQRCDAYQKWMSRLNPNGLTLIFPAAFINSPSSMFGHTFIRVDQPNQTEAGKVLAYSVNYAADASVQENQFALAYKGLFGGYRGITLIIPYHLKIKEYSDIESRDIWEYSLVLSPKETMQFARHIWEIESINFDYFYIDENCAYRILSLLQVARPSVNLVSDFDYIGIPTDTIRKLYDVGLISSTKYRPSLAVELQNAANQLSNSERKYAKLIAIGEMPIDDPHLLALTMQQQAAVLEVADNYLRYQLMTKKIDKSAAADIGYQLLLARSRLDAPRTIQLPEPPKVRDDEGHLSARFSIGAGYDRHDFFSTFKIRPAFHDLIDPLPGFKHGSQIEFFNTDFRISNKGTSTLEKMDLLNIQSFSPQDLFFKPMSWKVATGLKRISVKDEYPLVKYGQWGGGISYKVKSDLIYAMFDAEAQHGNRVDSKIIVGAGYNLGYLYHVESGQGKVELSHMSYGYGYSYDAQEVMWEHGININQNNAIRFKLAHKKSDEKTDNEISVGWDIYF